MTDAFDIYGICPVCNTNWDGGSIADYFVALKRKGHWPKKTEEQIKKEVSVFARSPKKFTNLEIKHKTGDHTLHQCPECECEFLTRLVKVNENYSYQKLVNNEEKK